jgi:predicted nucleic acid-binding protein
MYSPSLQFFPQQPHRTKHPQLRRARRNVQCLGDFRIRFVLYQPQSRRQLRKRFAQQHARLLLGRRIGLRLGRGLLDPADARTRGVTERIVAIIERRPSYRTLATDPEIWREAGILSGTLARLQGYKSDQRRRVLNDALLFATARKHGCAVLTRNVVDFDFLQQLDPSGKVLFYR